MSGAMMAAPATAMDVTLEEVASGLTAPLAMVQPDGDDRRFIMQQDGFIKILTADGEVLDEPFLDISTRLVDLLSSFDEEGLLGMTFHPDFANNGLFYVAYTVPIDPQGDLGKTLWWAHSTRVSEMRVSADDPNVADPGYERIVMKTDWPQFNHNGHWIDFGPDGMLYISTGDGGYANDWGIGHNPEIGNGQDLLTRMGKILRVDVNVGGEGFSIPEDNPFVDDAATALPEVWAYGLRNPWRCSFDMGGDNRLFCGDVQQNSYEEVSIVGAGDNLGWRVKEATHCFDFLAPNEHPDSCASDGMVEPIIEYKNCTAQPDGCEGISVTGGYVYRGSHADWDGKYFFGDWSKSFSAMDGQLFVATEGADGAWTKETLNVTNMDGNLPYVLAFAQDSAGEVYVLSSVTTGPVGGLDKIYRIAPAN
jgi:glucose/arabinose dehydrogenase